MITAPREDLVDPLRIRQEHAPARPHPSAGAGAAGNLIVGPLAAVFDRVRDRRRELGTRA